MGPAQTYIGVLSTLSVTSVVLGVLYLQYKYVWFTGTYLLRIVLDLSLILLLLATTTRIRIGNPWSRYLGTISYEVFLSHAAVMGLIERTGIALSSGEFVVCTLLGTIVLASVLHFVDARISWRVRNWGRPAVRGQPMRAAFLPVPAVRTQEPGDRGATGATPLTDGLSGRLVVAALEAAQASLDAERSTRASGAAAWSGGASPGTSLQRKDRLARGDWRPGDSTSCGTSGRGS